MVKKEVSNELNKPKIENPPSPFEYDSYSIDVGITERSNKEQRAAAIRRHTNAVLTINDL